MAYVRPDKGWLSIAFRYRGRKCIEYLHLEDNRSNRAEAARRARLVTRKMARGDFDYEKEFPDSPNLTKLGLRRDQIPTFKEFAEQWAIEHATAVSPGGMVVYKAALEHVHAAPFANRRLDQIHDGDITTFLSAERGRPHGRNGKPTGAAWNNRIRSVIGMIFDLAKRRRLIAENPVFFVKKARVTKENCDPFTLEEALKLIDLAPGWQKNLYTVLIFAGLRPNEALALRWTDIDWAHDLIQVRRTLRRVGDREGPPKTRDSERDVEMLSIVRDALKDQQAYTRLKRSGRIFSTADDEPISLDNFRLVSWHKLINASGLRYRPLYQCRHTYASLRLEAGDSVQHVAHQLGHASIKMVNQVYARWRKTPKSIGSDALTRAITAIRDESQNKAADGETENQRSV